MKQIFKIAAYGGAFMGIGSGIADYAIDLLFLDNSEHLLHYIKGGTTNALKYSIGIASGALVIKHNLFTPT